MLWPRRLAQQHLNRGLAQFKPIGLMASQPGDLFAAAAENAQVFWHLDAATAKFLNDEQGQGVVETIDRRRARRKPDPVFYDFAGALFSQFREDLPGTTPRQAAFAQGLAVAL